MSNAKSPSRSRSRSGSRSRSRSFSHSRTRSRSWSRKHRYSSRSRSQSRSRSASYSRDRNYGKEYQNNRGFRGYNRGYRRPYYYRGRGFFPRGRYQRGVDGYGCGTYRHNNWQDYRGQQQPVGEKEPRSPRRARSRSRTPRKRSGSPHSRSRSRRSNRSSSGLSCHSSSSSSRYSSPKCHGKGKKERKSKGKQMSRTSCVPSLPRASPQLRSAIVIGQGAPVSTHVGPSPSAAMGSSVAPWKSIGPVAPGESPPEAALAGAFSGFGFFSKGSLKAREKSAVSPAFHKFLVEHQNKEGPEWERGLNPFDGERERGAAKPTGLVHSSPKAEKEAERKEHKQLCFWPQGVKEPGEQRGDTPPTGRLMAEALGRWEASNPAATDVPGPDNEEGGNLEKELYYSRKRERTTAATSRERAVVGKDSFPEWLPRGSTKERPVDSPPRARPPMWNWKEEVFGHRGSPLCYKLASCAETVAKERRLCQDLVHHKPKEQEFRSIFQHIEAAQFQRSPSEVFAQHMVAIVHHVKARHFRPSELTLHDRFSLYLRQAAESDMKPWKSPEIHRRINVSPSTFKRHSHVFEDTRSCRDVDYKATQDAGARRRSLSSDLQVDQEQAASYSGRERAAAKTPEDSSVSSRGRFSEKPAKHHKKSKKSKKKRSHSSSCSAEHRLQDSTSGVETFSKVHGALFDHDAAESSQDHKGFFGMKSRGWSMGNYCRNHTDSDPSDTVVGKCPSVVEWDTECMPKSKKYHLHDDRVMEGKWLEHGPHGQGQHTQVPNSFLYHKGNGNPKWAPDNLQVTMEEGELQEDGELEPPEGGIIAPKH